MLTQRGWWWQSDAGPGGGSAQDQYSHPGDTQCMYTRGCCASKLHFHRFLFCYDTCIFSTWDFKHIIVQSFCKNDFRGVPRFTFFQHFAARCSHKILCFECPVYLFFFLKLPPSPAWSPFLWAPTPSCLAWRVSVFMQLSPSLLSTVCRSANKCIRLE